MLVRQRQRSSGGEAEPRGTRSDATPAEHQARSDPPLPGRPADPAGRRARRRAVDPSGELYGGPEFLRYVWLGLVLLVALEGSNDIFQFGKLVLSQDIVHDVVLFCSVVLLLARAAYERVGRGAWISFALAQAMWTTGTVAWGFVYAGQSNPPAVSFCDVFWLLWYPFMAAGIMLLIRVRVAHFELHRWMDGLAAVLVVMVAGFAVILQPLADHSGESALENVVTFSYPVLDLLLLGAVLGVYGLLAWHPDRMWTVLGLGIAVTTLPDAVSTIQEAQGVNTALSVYTFVWSIGALLLTYAAWIPAQGGPAEHEVTGLRAVALALLAQGVAAGVQIYGLFFRIGDSERVLTLAILVVASVQIYLTRPRAPAGRAEPTPASRPAQPSPAAGLDAGAGTVGRDDPSPSLAPDPH